MERKPRKIRATNPRATPGDAPNMRERKVKAKIPRPSGVLDPTVLEHILRPVGSDAIRQLVRDHPNKPSVAEAEAENFTAWRDERITSILAELARRKCEALRLYVPQPIQEQFHACRASERIMRGGNRSGKSVSCAVEFARAVTEQDPHDKYPKGSGGVAVIVGYDQNHVGQTIYPILFKPGAFKIIRDPASGRWRAFQPLNEWDKANARLARPAPPLIPKRFVKRRTWVKKGKEVFSVVHLHNGWEIWGFSSRGKPPQGFKADVCWFDEDIDDPEWVDESSARLADRNGRMFWSAMPHSRNAALLRLSQRAWDQQKQQVENPDIAEFRMSFSGNIHIDEETKRKKIDAWRWSGDDVARRRDAGEYTVDDFKVFPEFHMGVHGVSPESREFVAGQLPKSWCRFAVIDPGYRICAVLFAAVPPPEFGEFVYLEDELYIPHCTAEMLGQKMKTKIQGKRYQAWIIDDPGSARSEVNGKSIRQQYIESFSKHDIASEATGHRFWLGSRDRLARVESVRRWMAPRELSPPKLRVVEGRLPNFLAEIETYYRKLETDPLDKSRRLATDMPDDRGASHLMVCLQYLAHERRVRYVPPTGIQDQSPGDRGFWEKYLNDKRERFNRRNGKPQTYINLGPGR